MNHRWSAALTAVTALAPHPAFAQADPAAVAAGAVAGATAASNQPATVGRELPGPELDDWRDSRTGTTARLVHRCGHTVEARLSGTSAANYVTVTIANQGREPSTFSPWGVVAAFEAGPDRRLIPFDGEDHALEPGWWGKWVLRFPEKADFGDTDTIRLTLSLVIRDRDQPCAVEIRLRRDPRVQRRAETSTDYTAFELFLEGGSRVFASGGQKTLSGNDGATFGVGATGFLSVHHGFFGELAIERYGEEGLPSLGPAITVMESDSLGSATVWAGYAGRVYLLDRLIANYSVGLGPYVISLSDDDRETPSTEKVFFALRQRLRLDVAFGRTGGDTWFGFGLGVHHLVVPDGTFGEAGASGHALSVTGAGIVAM